MVWADNGESEPDDREWKTGDGWPEDPNLRWHHIDERTSGCSFSEREEFSYGPELATLPAGGSPLENTGCLEEQEVNLANGETNGAQGGAGEALEIPVTINLEETMRRVVRDCGPLSAETREGIEARASVIAANLVTSIL